MDGEPWAWSPPTSLSPLLPCSSTPFSSGSSEEFLLIFSFQQFACDMCGCDFLLYFLFWGGGAGLLQIVSLCLSPNLGKFELLGFHIFSLSFLSWDPSGTHATTFGVPQPCLTFLPSEWVGPVVPCSSQLQLPVQSTQCLFYLRSCFSFLGFPSARFVSLSLLRFPLFLFIRSIFSVWS